MAKHAAFQYTINNKFYTKAAADCPALTGTSIADDKARVFTVTIDTAGTTAIYASDEVDFDANFDLSKLVNETINSSSAVSSGELPVGFIVVINETGSAFTGGTTALDAANVTTYYINNFGVVNWVD